MTMGTDGEYFNFPTTEKEHVACWQAADRLTKDIVPDGMETPGDYRYVCNSTWAYRSQAEQVGYFAEIEALENNPYIVVIQDSGDGCVSHFYVTRPDSCPPDEQEDQDNTDDEET